MKQKNELDFIKYILNTETRDIVVIDGRAFYRSTGNNSDLSGVWLPFVCVKGKSESLNFERIRSNKYSLKLIGALCSGCYSNQYLIKTDVLFDHDDRRRFLLSMEYQNYGTDQISKLLDRCASPEAHQECLKISCSLGGGIWEDNASKQLIIKQFLNDTTPDPLTIKDKPVFETSDPEQINQWLYSSGAQIVGDLFKFPQALPTKKNDTTPDLLTIKDKPVFETSDPEQINQLYSSGAQIVGNLFKFPQALPTKKVEFIRYQTNISSFGEKTRDIVVIDGLSFYRSTGHSSELPNVWLPFVCIKGKPESLDEERFCTLVRNQQYSSELGMAMLVDNHPPSYIIKIGTLFKPRKLGVYLDQYMNMLLSHTLTNNTPLCQLLKRCASPVFNEECLKISYSLGGGIWNDNAIKGLVTKHFLTNATPAPITLCDTPLFTSDDPGKINQWLYESGAKFVGDIFKFPATPHTSNNSNNSNSSNNNVNHLTELTACTTASVPDIKSCTLNMSTYQKLEIVFPDELACQQWHDTFAALANNMGIDSFFAKLTNNPCKISINRSSGSDLNSLGMFTQLSAATLHAPLLLSIHFKDKELLKFFKSTLNIGNEQLSMLSETSLFFKGDVFSLSKPLLTQLNKNALAEYALAVSEIQNQSLNLG